ncbi:hypothetical protein GCM10009127_17720 [Alteraurantiacibacter aestuarii]|uniref:Lipoprotein n=1 Tax=Alteraurantiacibacter aestuarii TaxID=650004 RepID=A0A844ZJJ9_9SPHN|nr:hypothetical protein [Alteraurantiacibacter aestuarii]MXO87643.1 hypothetical protein [Alteraurantiacibacter aestuarii]
MNRLLTTGAVLLLASCAVPEDPVPTPDNGLPSLAADRSQPQLALMDHILGNYFASDVPLRPTICASTHDGRSEVALAPEAELALMTRYEALAPFARCASIDGVWQDSETGGPAMVFTIHSFSCPDADHCSGFGGYVAGQTNSMSVQYTMAFADGGWTFTRDPRLIGES